MIPSGATKSPTPTPPAFSSTKSMSYDGVDDYIKADIGVEAYKQSTIRSFSFWVKINTLNTFTPFFCGKGTGTLFRYTNVFGVRSGRLRWSLEGLNQSTACYIETELVDGTGTAPNIGDGNWHHLVLYNAVDSHTNKANVVDSKIYLDGSELTNTTENTGTAAVRGFEAGVVCLGAGLTSGSSGQIYLDGLIDEFAYWNNHELTSSQVNDIYNSGTPNELSTVSPSSTAWYQLGENGSWNSPQWLLPQETNKDKVSNYSFEFDGIDDYITCSNFNSLASVNTFTVSFWAKFNTVALNDTLLNHYSTLGFRADAQNNKMTFRWSSSDSTTVLVQSTNTITTGTWKHYACTYDNTDFKLYENGSLISTTNEPSKTYRSNLNQNLLMGKYWFGLQRLFDGQLTQVAVWDSVQDITSIYNSGTPTTITEATNYWKMGEDATFSTNWSIPETIGSSTGTSNAMTIENRIGEAPNSTKNALSVNQLEADRKTDVPS